MGNDTPAGAQRGGLRARALALCALGLLVAFLGGCDTTTQGPVPPTVPPGWHGAALPFAADVIRYTISPDVPGLLLACAGTATTVSAAPPNPATLYRSRDYGATWQALAGPPDLHVGCVLAAPAGDHGTFFLINYFGAGSTTNDTDEYVAVTHDDGDSWKTVLAQPTTNATEFTLRHLFEMAQRGGLYYRGGTLYGLPLAQPDQSSATAFGVSHDDGKTWTMLEATPAHTLGTDTLVPVAIAPDQRSANAWYRLSEPVAPMGSTPSPNPIQLQHSADNGRTWQTISTVGPEGIQEGTEAHSIATSASAPGRVCVATSAVSNSLASAQPSTAGTTTDSTTETAALTANYRDASASRLGPPGPTPHTDGLYASDDGGKTWTSDIIGSHPNDYGTLSQVKMGADGSCYALDTVAQYGTSGQDTATIWRLSPGSKAPSIAIRVVGYLFEDFALQPAAAPTPARYIVSAQAFYTNCQGVACTAAILSTPLVIAWKDVA